MGTHELLAPFNPLLKFMVVKMVVFLTFWQVRRPNPCVITDLILNRLALGHSLNGCQAAVLTRRTNAPLCAAYAWNSARLTL